MDTIFPFGFPLATAFYLTLFVTTLVLHVLFMNYVLAGTAWLAWSIVIGRVRLGSKSVDISKREPATSESILADWIPTMLSRWTCGLLFEGDAKAMNQKKECNVRLKLLPSPALLQARICNREKHFTEIKLKLGWLLRGNK